MNVYLGPKIDLNAEAEVHFPCASCGAIVHEDLLDDEQLCIECEDEV